MLLVRAGPPRASVRTATAAAATSACSPGGSIAAAAADSCHAAPSLQARVPNDQFAGDEFMWGMRGAYGSNAEKAWE